MAAAGIALIELSNRGLHLVDLQASPERAIRLRETLPNLDTLFMPDTHYMSLADSLERKPYRVRSDDNGYILPSGFQRNYNLTLLFLGESSTESLYVDETERFPYLVSKDLQMIDQNYRVRSLNAGVSGNASIHSLNNYLNKGLSSRPDLVIILHNVNDLTLLLRTNGNYWSRDGFMISEKRSLIYEPESSLPGIARKYLPVMSYCWRMARVYWTVLKGGIQPIRANSHRHFSTAIANARHSSNTKLFDGLKEKQIVSEFQKSLKRLVGAVKSSGSTPVLMTQMNRFTAKPSQVVEAGLAEPLVDYRMSYDSYRSLYNRFNQSIRDVALEEDVHLIDLAKQVPQSEKYMYDSVHLNGRGSRLVARIISNNLALMLSPRRKLHKKVGWI